MPVSSSIMKQSKEHLKLASKEILEAPGIGEFFRTTHIAENGHLLSS
jgi:hypothetical protein